MATPMISTDFRVIVEPILSEEFDGVYDQRADEWSEVFNEIQGTPRQYHEEPMLYGMGAAPVMPEGTPVTYQSGGVLFVQRYDYLPYGLAFALSKILVEDGDHIRIGTIYARHLAQSLIETKELLCANVLNRAFNSSYTGGDGVSLINTAHPIVNGTFSNQLTTAANLSQTSVEQLLIQIRSAVDNNGKKIRLNPTKFVVSPSNTFQAEVILKSVLRAGTNNNDVNPVQSMGLLKEGQACLSRLTSNTAWWIEAETPGMKGLQWVNRRSLEKSMEGDFETDSMRYKATFRGKEGWTDPRNLWGTSGV